MPNAQPLAVKIATFQVYLIVPAEPSVFQVYNCFIADTFMFFTACLW